MLQGEGLLVQVRFVVFSAISSGYNGPFLDSGCTIVITLIEQLSSLHEKTAGSFRLFLFMKKKNDFQHTLSLPAQSKCWTTFVIYSLLLLIPPALIM